MKMFFITLVCSLLSLVSAFGEKLPTIVTTCTMVTDLVQNIAGEKAEVMGLMKEGVDPHLYKPTRDDLVVLPRILWRRV